MLFLGIYISCRRHLIARDWTARVCLVSRPLCVELSLSPCHLELVKEGWTSSSLIRHPDLKKYFYFRAMVATQTFTIEFFMLDLDCLHTGRGRGPSISRSPGEKIRHSVGVRKVWRVEYCHIPINYAHVYGPILHVRGPSYTLPYWWCQKWNFTK